MTAHHEAIRHTIAEASVRQLAEPFKDSPVNGTSATVFRLTDRS